MSVPLRFGDIELLDDAFVTHFGVPSTGAGAKDKRWQRRMLTVLSSELDLDSLRVSLGALDVRDFLANFWDTAESEDAPDSRYSGVARLDAGAGRLFLRSTDAWIDNPAAAAGGSLQAILVGANVEKLATLGGLIEGSRKGELANAAFNGGLTSWTQLANGTTIGTDTGDLLFATNVSDRSATIQAPANGGAGMSGNGLVSQASALLTANSKVSASLDHKDDTGHQVSLALRRGVDNRWWDEASRTWVVAETMNRLPVASVVTRHDIRNVDVGAANTTVTVWWGIEKVTAANNQKHHVYCSQLEAGSYPTSRIVPRSGTLTRAADDLKIENFPGRLVWDPAQGHAFCRFRPLWNTADLTTGQVLTIAEAYWDAANYDRLFYEQGRGFVFRRRAGGVNYDVVKATTVVAGQLYKLRPRWTGVEGDLDLAPYTLSLAVDGVLAANTVATGYGSLPTKGYLRIGARDNAGAPADLADGYITRRLVSPFVPDDLEMAGDEP